MPTSVSFLFHLLVFGEPLLLLHPACNWYLETKIIQKLCINRTHSLHWTTPLLYGIPMVLSGTKVYNNNIGIIVASKEHGSTSQPTYDNLTIHQYSSPLAHLTSFTFLFARVETLTSIYVPFDKFVSNMFEASIWSSDVLFK